MMEKIGEIGIVGADKRGRNRMNQTDIGIIRRKKGKGHSNIREIR